MKRFIIIGMLLSLMCAAWLLSSLSALPFSSWASRKTKYNPNPLKSVLLNATVVKVYDFTGPLGSRGKFPVAVMSESKHFQELNWFRHTRQFTPYSMAGLATAVFIVTDRDGSQTSLGYGNGSLRFEAISSNSTFSGSAIVDPQLNHWIKILRLAPRFAVQQNRQTGRGAKD